MIEYNCKIPFLTLRTVNVNPFTPNNRNNQSCQLNSAKRLRYSREISSRYKSDFVEQCKIGVGEFGDVFKVQNRLDGCIYAIKKTKNPIRGSRAEYVCYVIFNEKIEYFS